MANFTLNAEPAFSGSCAISAVDLNVACRDDLTITHICAAKGKAHLVNAAIQGAYGKPLPTKPQRVAMNCDVEMIWAGLDQWIAVAPRGKDRDLEQELKPVLRGLAAVTDQSDARAIVRVSGDRARGLLAKGVPIDLDPRVFPENGAAITHASHIGVVLWQVGSDAVYDLAVFRSFADSFERWLRHSAHA